MNKLDNTEVFIDVVPNKKKTGLIIGTVAAVIVAGAGILYAAVPSVKNNVRMTFMKPENYCASVYHDMTDKISRDTETSIITEHNAVHMDLSVEIDDLLMNDIRDQLESDLFNKLAFSVDDFAVDKNEKTTIVVNADDRKVISSEVIKYGDTAYIKIPEINEKYLSYDISEMLSLYSVDSRGTLPSGEEISEIIKKYGDSFAELMADSKCTIEKGYEGSAEGVNYKYNRITTEISAENMKGFLNRTADMLSDDSVLRDIFEDSNTEKSGLYDRFIESIRQEADLISPDNYSYTIITYVDSNGYIMGISILYEEDEHGFIMAKDNGCAGFRFNILDKKIAFKATEDDGAYSGTLSISDGDEEQLLNFENIEIIDKKYISGNISADISELTDENISVLALAFEKSGNAQKISTEADGVGKISIEYNTYRADNEDITEPENSISMDDAEEYLSDTDAEKLISNIFTALGVNEEYIQYLVDMMISGSVFDGIAGTSYDDDEYDYNWDQMLEYDLELDDML